MRLIDADALDKTLVEAQAECKKNGGNFRFGVLSNVRANIANAPTIDAIPVEWLQDKMLNSPKELSISAWRVLNEWHPRKEAQK